MGCYAWLRAPVYCSRVNSGPNGRPPLHKVVVGFISEQQIVRSCRMAAPVCQHLQDLRCGRVEACRQRRQCRRSAGVLPFMVEALRTCESSCPFIALLLAHALRLRRPANAPSTHTNFEETIARQLDTSARATWSTNGEGAGQGDREARLEHCWVSVSSALGDVPAPAHPEPGPDWAVPLSPGAPIRISRKRVEHKLMRHI